MQPWGRALLDTPPFEILSSYADMMLATSDIASGVKSYGHSLSDFSRFSLSENSGDSLIAPASPYCMLMPPRNPPPENRFPSMIGSALSPRN